MKTLAYNFETLEIINSFTLNNKSTKYNLQEQIKIEVSKTHSFNNYSFFVTIYKLKLLKEINEALGFVYATVQLI